MASIKLGSRIDRLLSRTGLPAQRAIAAAWLASIADAPREATA
jgi:hypothetical protein